MVLGGGDPDLSDSNPLKKAYFFREAAKKVIALMAGPLRP